ncbi:MAG: helix-turn-helix domain-containing protein, partial [Candidatus Dormibacteria bacterium]
MEMKPNCRAAAVASSPVPGTDNDAPTVGLTDAAILLRISEDCLLRKARAGRVPGAKIGRQWVFIRTDLLELIRKQARERACHSIANIRAPTG